MRTNPCAVARVCTAQAVREQLLQLRRRRIVEADRCLGALLGQGDRVRCGRHKLAVCLSRGWLAAAEQVNSEIESALRNLPHYIRSAEGMILDRPTEIPTIREIVEALDQLADEFDEVVCNRSGGTISVTTEPIELADTYLGPFEIRLDVNRIATVPAQASFDVVARDPHPATANEAVTHPHVSDQRLCCGDASLTVKAALEGGRLADFFCIIAGVLRTYNADSAYVTLAEWSGRACWDCGFVMPEDEAGWCNSCERDHCSECLSYCTRCDESTCGSCLTECGVCGDRFCNHCLTTCPNCGEAICRTCLEEALCPCMEAEEERDDDDDQDDAADSGTTAAASREAAGGIREEAA